MSFSAVLKFAIFRSSYNRIICSVLGLVVALDLVAYDLSSDMFELIVIYLSIISYICICERHFSFKGRFDDAFRVAMIM